MPITYGSVCSGIEAATVAWHPLGMRASWFAEIEAFPSAVLAHRYPDVPNLGDMTKIAGQVLTGAVPAPDVLVGGTPCQAFSVAGMRAGLADPRGALTIKYVELADAIDHVRTARGDDECVTVWENVPGVLSDKGNAFGCFLAALVGESDALLPSGGRWTDAGCVYGPKRTAAWRVLDAQYFGLAQRRRRVFVVASARAGFDPCEVLFEREGVRRDTPPRRGQGQDLTGHAPFRPALQCGCGCTFDEGAGPYGCPNCEGDEGPAASVIAGVRAFGGHSLDGEVSQSATLTAKDMRLDIESETFFVAPQVAGTLRSTGGGSDVDHGMAGHLIAGTLQAAGKAAGSATMQDAESGLLVVHGTQDPDVLNEQAHPLGRNQGQESAVLAFSCKDYGNDVTVNLSPTLRAMGHGDSHANAGGQVAVAVIQNATRGKDQNGLGVSPGDEPMYTLDQASQHAVCVTGDITHTLKAEGFDASEDGTGRGQPIVAHAIQAGALRTNPESGPDGVGVQADHAYTLEARAEVQAVQVASAVRRLTPVECERLQGFEDNYTLIPWRGKPAEECPDGPRYKAIGNSKARPVVRWIGVRLLAALGFLR